jgi:hypothetical protein
VAFFTHFTPLRTQKSEVTALEIGWKQHAVHHPFLWHAEVVCAIGWVIQAINNSSSPLIRELLVVQSQQRGRALELLRKEVERPDAQWSDAHIHAVAGLAVSSDPPLEYTEPYPLSPLGELQRIHALARFKTTIPHLEAMYKSVEMRGGIRAMTTHALAEVLQMYVRIMIFHPMY